jgi:small neutral amino acid transporter SnatA (MarC family)
VSGSAIRRAALAAAMLVAVSGAAFATLSPPQLCPAVSVPDLRASATAAATWFVRNQQPDGTWLYEYNADTDRASPTYNDVRHAGAVMGLYQAAAAGIPGALESADRGAKWALARLLEHDGWAAVSVDGGTSTGSTALLVAGLAGRRLVTNDPRYDAVMARLARFLVAQTEPSGAVRAYYDLVTNTSVAGSYSKYYTGETYWALARMNQLFPDQAWGATADRIGAYLATERDEREDYWPPIPDHWAAYGLAETVDFADRPPDLPLTSEEVAYARRQAELFGGQVRWISQRFGPWGQVVRGHPIPRGGGYGVIGEGLTGLWRVSEADRRLADLRTQIGERAVCDAGLAIRAQSDAPDAARYVAPAKVEGAWFRDGVTRMDDQQHALAALLRTIPIVEAGSDQGSGRHVPAAWLWLIAIVAAVNPCRAAFGVPRRGASRRGVAAVAALGAALGAAAVVLLAIGSGPLLDAADVSSPAVRIAAGAVAAVAGVLQMIRRPPSPEPSLPGWGAAIVPVAIPLFIAPAVVALAVGANADRGAGFVVGAIAMGAAFLVLACLAPLRDTRARVMRWAAHLTAAALLATSVLLVIAGILDV